MQEFYAESIFPSQCDLGEGPVWDFLHAKIYWVDIQGRHLHWLQTGSGESQAIPLPSEVGFAVPTKRGDFLAGTRQGFVRLELSSGEVTPLIDPEAHLPGNRFNDGKCDPQGRIWAGTLSDDRTPGAGALYRLDPDGSVTKIRDDITISNGLCWSIDGQTMYYIDSATYQIVAYDFDGLAGTITNPRTVVEVAKEQGKPDGMTIDRFGMLWVALWDGWSVMQFDPESGTPLAKIQLPVQRVTSCCFGGANFDKLYITTARTGLSEAELDAQPLAGNLFLAKPEVAGMPASYFAG